MRVTKQKLRSTQRESVAKIASLLGAAFTWGETKQGHDYWEEVHGHLTDLAARRDICPECLRELPE